MARLAEGVVLVGDLARVEGQIDFYDDPALIEAAVELLDSYYQKQLG